MVLHEVHLDTCMYAAQTHGTNIFFVKLHSLGSATIAFAQPSYTVVEGSGSIDVCVQILGLPIGGLGCDVTVDFNLLPGLIASMYLFMYVCELLQEI